MADKAIATGTARDLVFMLAKLEDDTVYDVVPHREKRSLNANGLLWACISEIANKIGHDKWSVYLNMLKSYGQYTYVLCKPHAVAKMKEIWRETEEIGEVDVNGQKSVQLLCYYGSSTYTTKEFSRLLDGVIQEMKNIGLEPPPSEQMKEALLAWSKMTNGE
jgi:hypothetical protein